jgi:hypothetical protein
MKEQITAMVGVFTNPKRTMQDLPSHRLYVLAIIAPVYFGIARAFKPRNHDLLLDWLGSNWMITLSVIVLAAIMIPVGGWLMQQLLRLFRKRLSVVKILNISGYARVPRLAVAALGYIAMYNNPKLFAADRPSSTLLVIIALGIAALLYSQFLTIYGFVVSPSEEMAGANQGSHATSEPAPGAASSAREG